MLFCYASSPSLLSQFEFVTVLIVFVKVLRAGLCNTHVMSAQWILLNAILAIGIVIAGVLGFLLFQGEVLVMILFGVPSIIVVGGALWLTHSLFARFA